MSYTSSLTPKVVHIITRLDPGGLAENTLLTCQYLASRGWTARLAAGPGKRSETAKIGGSAVEVIPLPSLQRDPAPVADARALVQIYRLLRREKPAILHTHSAKAGILGRWAGLLARVPHIVHTPHGHVIYGYAKGIKNWAYLQAERLTAPLTDRLVALSEGERRESAEHGIGRLDQWVVIPSGIELTKLPAATRSSAPRQGPVKIGVVARLEPVKGLDILIRAAAILRAEAKTAHEARGDASANDFEVLVWGDGEQRQQLAALVESEAVGGLIRFVGTEEPAASFMERLDIYVQPSRNEGMGRALAMAQGLGLPVLATRVCGIPDIVRDGESGLLVDSDNPRDLALGLERLIRDAALRRRLAEGARRWIETADESGHPRFSVEAMLWHIERLYRQLARTSQRLPAARAQGPR
ncbi:MAG: glycosyltransferase family 4 protein [Acidobacteriota bacterium]